MGRNKKSALCENKYRLFLTINGPIFLQKIATKQNYKKNPASKNSFLYMNGNLLSMTAIFHCIASASIQYGYSAKIKKKMLASFKNSKWKSQNLNHGW